MSAIRTTCGRLLIEQDPVIIINGLTKGFRLPGWRVCWVRLFFAFPSLGSWLTWGRSLRPRLSSRLSRRVAASWTAVHPTRKTFSGFCSHFTRTPR